MANKWLVSKSHFTKQQREIAMHILHSEKARNMRRLIFNICFSIFDAVLHILFEISLTV